MSLHLETPSPDAPSTPARPPANFSTDLKNAAQVVRSALSELMLSAGLDPQDPQALTRKWGINKILSWKIAKVVQTDDPFLALQQLPRKNGIDILLKTGEKAGAEDRFLRTARQAFEHFEEFVKLHCGNRNTFDMMGAELSIAGRQQREEAHRKQLFQSASYVWGAQARTYLNVRVVAPSAGTTHAETVDIACIAGVLDFRRLRENLPWVMTRRAINRNDGTPYPLSAAEPLDKSATGQIVPLMANFCSKPTPVINVVRIGNADIAELAPGEVGNAGVLSYMAGIVERNLSNIRTPTDLYGDFWAISNTPVELVIFDVFIHKSLAYAIPPKVMLTSLLGPMSIAGLEHERYQLPLYEPLLDLGWASPAPVTPDVPRYAEMIQTAFDSTGWTPGEFRGFRLKMPYPPISSALIMRYPLPEAPAK